MTDEGTPSTLIVVAIIIQFITMMLFAVGAGFLYSMLPLLDMILASIPPSALPPGLTIADLARIWHIGTIALAGVAVLSLVFIILWIFWRKEPSKHRVGLIITGIVGLVVAGFLGGLLALIAGAIGEKKPELGKLPLTRSAPTPPGKGVAYCSACGAALAEPTASFCGGCGVKVT
jgi:amino acid transporter